MQNCGMPPPLCKLEKRFEHIKAMFQTYDLQFWAENRTDFGKNNFLLCSIFLSNFLKFLPPPLFSKSCVRYCLQPHMILKTLFGGGSGTPSEGWGRGGTPRRPNNRATPQDLQNNKKFAKFLMLSSGSAG